VELRRATLELAARHVEDACSVVDKQRARLDLALMEREAGLLATEIADHDVAGRFRAVIR
jgi:hypothetical protein